MVSALNFTICSSFRLFVFLRFSSFRVIACLISNKQREDTIPRARKKKRNKFFSSRITHICQTKDEGMNELSN